MGGIMMSAQTVYKSVPRSTHEIYHVNPASQKPTKISMLQEIFGYAPFCPASSASLYMPRRKAQHATCVQNSAFRIARPL